MLSKSGPNHLGLLKRPDGTLTSSEQETLVELIRAHFPGAVCNGTVVEQPASHYRTHSEDWRKAALIIRPKQLEWAVSSFKPYKACGKDGIFPALLQRGMEILLPHLIKIYRASFACGYIPSSWTKVKVIFIPKAGRKDYSLPKAFRPISLTSFLLKMLEKVLDLHIRGNILKARPIHFTQHAYRKGRSTETALLNLVDKIEKALEDKEIALGTFLDVEGAFDNTPVESLIRGLMRKQTDQTTVRWVKSMLTNRRAFIALNDTTVKFTSARGCPQGGVLSPLLWTLVLDELLYKMAELRYDVQGYADDLVIIIRGFCQMTISNRMQKALNLVRDWCAENELSINADKTVIVPFTNKRRLDNLKRLNLNGIHIPLSKEVKYLGVTIDQKLKWNNHLDNTLTKAKTALGICGRMAGSIWGLKPKMMLWLYTMLVRPMISYASVVWWSKCQQSTVKIKLNSLQRTACRMMTGAMSTCPGAALNALLDLPPLDLHIKKVARDSIFRISVQGNINWTSNKLRTFKDSIMKVNVLTMISDSMLPHCNFVQNYRVEIPSREEWKTGLLWKVGCLIWYTDGSKMGTDVGCGIYGVRPRYKESINLGKYASIFQAEVYAIIACATLNLQRNYKHQTIYINSDSQAALKALISSNITSKLVLDCLTKLNTLGNNNRVILRWVPGHEGYEGNECADELARAGAEGKTYGPEPICGIPHSLARSTINNLTRLETLKHWETIPGLNHSKALIKPFDAKASKERMGLSKNNLRIITRALTGHCCLNKHLANLKIADTKACRFCHKEDETPLHLLCECGSLMRKRYNTLGKHFLEPADVRQLSAKEILQYLKGADLCSEL